MALTFEKKHTINNLVLLFSLLSLLFLFLSINHYVSRLRITRTIILYVKLMFSDFNRV